MSYKVLARKWRPQHFRDMLGQEPVLRALGNALDSNRLHHAYLFTGMRGVGKTTIARIFAKCLNCETNGVSANPCGECNTCKDIEAGRFFDLIEVDAASRTKVEETRELLENVPYAPASGRYKVYLIDEVHMFSNHSFNALLKTLEEPPEHVKFLLATTDPQKVPVTVLSRCLQFNLKRMAPGILADYLAGILTEEKVEHERPALDLIARASEGSVRDALSLVEQGAAYGEGAVREADVEAMLGRASIDRLLGLIESLAKGDMAELFERVEQLAEYAPDFAELMGELLTLLHRVALLQTVPNSVDEHAPGFDKLTALSSTIDPAEVQLYYQIGVHARRDMPFAPDPREVFDMALLRMNAFKPQQSIAGASSVITNTADAASPAVSATPAAATTDTKRPNGLPVRGEVSAGGALRAAALAAARGETVPDAIKQAAAPGPGPKPDQAHSPVKTIQAAPMATTQPAAAHQATPPVKPAQSATTPATAAAPAVAPPAQSAASSPKSVAAPTAVIDKQAVKPTDWHQIIQALDISGMPRQLASNSELVSLDATRLNLRLESSSEHLNTARFADRLQAAVSTWLGRDVQLHIDMVDAPLVTPTRIDEQEQADAMAAARDSIGSDPLVRQLIDKVDAAVDEASISPIDTQQ